jgi:hypothetical protein
MNVRMDDFFIVDLDIIVQGAKCEVRLFSIGVARLLTGTITLYPTFSLRLASLPTTKKQLQTYRYRTGTYSSCSFLFFRDTMSRLKK